MSRQDNQNRGKASGRGSNNQRNRSNARGNAPLNSESLPKKNRASTRPYSQAEITI